MKCPYCSQDNDRVLDTRVQKDGAIRRRRECNHCKGRFSTNETLVVSYPFIIKKDGRREPFSKEKIQRGIQAACQKRPVSQIQLEQIVDRISNWVLGRAESELPARLLGRKVMAELKQVDDVAYVRFASVYQTFKGVQEFVDTLELEDLIDMNDPNSPQLMLTPQGLNT